MHSDRLDRLHRAVDRQAGERVQIVPYTAGAYLAGGPDLDRAAFALCAIVNEVPAIARTAGNATHSGHNAELRTASHTILFVTPLLPYRPRNGDHVVLLDRGETELKINSVEPFGTGRTLARLEPLNPQGGTP